MKRATEPTACFANGNGSSRAAGIWTGWMACTPSQNEEAYTRMCIVIIFINLRLDCHSPLYGALYCTRTWQVFILIILSRCEHFCMCVRDAAQTFSMLQERLELSIRILLEMFLLLLALLFVLCLCGKVTRASKNQIDGGVWLIRRVRLKILSKWPTFSLKSTSLNQLRVLDDSVREVTMWPQAWPTKSFEAISSSTLLHRSIRITEFMSRNTMCVRVRSMHSATSSDVKLDLLNKIDLT